MIDLISLFLLGFVVSLDSFTVGFTYGMRTVKIPFKSLVIISSCTFVVLLLAMLIGSVIELYISYEAAERLGGIILIVLGIWVMYQFFTTNINQGVNKIIEIKIKPLGLISKMFKRPMEADFDNSGSISSAEAILLGLALSLDSFGAGIGAALIDLPTVLFSVVVTVSSASFVLAGINLGLYFRHIKFLEKLTFLPGIVLILVGIFKI